LPLLIMGFSERRYAYDNRGPVMNEWTAVLTIIVANVAIWVANLIAAGTLPINSFLALRGDLPQNPLEVWQLVTYGFVHDSGNPWHLLFNMLAIFFFGREVEALLGRSEFFRFYVTSIVIAGIAWVASVQIGQPQIAARTSLVGASGAVMAVLAMFIWYFPRQTVYIYGVLPVPAWALGVLFVVLDLQGATSKGTNVAHVAHLAGAAFGLLYAWRGWNLGGLTDFSLHMKRRLRGMKVVHPDDEFRSPRKQQQTDDEDLRKEVDRILEKIGQSGESSLSQTERETLTRASERFKQRSQ
ncbi:MAG: rhomboid family intramembrane serine protease, partial [Pirellulales bacterium]